MARKCYVTGLGTVTGNNRPHSLKASRRTWKANRALRSGLVKRA